MESEKEYVARIDALSDDELHKLIDDDACPYEPERLVGTSLGMFHCYLCGEMVLAGIPHPRRRHELKMDDEAPD